MSQKTNTNIQPYFDDFDPAKDFYRILFRAGQSLQARELTQLQSILQNQIEKLALGTFQEGQMIVPGDATYIDNAKYLKISRITSNSGASDYIGYTLTGQVTGVTAKVIHAEPATIDDSIVFFIKYLSANGSDTVFQGGESLLSDHPKNLTAVAGVDNVTIPTVVTIDSYDNNGGLLGSNKVASPAQGIGTYYKIQSGIYYLRGFMVQIEEQVLTLSKFHKYPSCKLGFYITESIVTPEDDTSLLDNAQGFSNTSAPGAHRLKITATLAKYPLSSTDPNFIEIARVVNGTLQRRASRNSFKWLFDLLARRTSDESGDYIIKPFNLNLKEWINKDSTDGLYTLSSVDNKYGPGDGTIDFSKYNQTSDGSYYVDETGQIIFNYGVITDRYDQATADGKYVIAVGEGKAYVSGYELQSSSTSFIAVDKARDTQFIDNFSISVPEGSHCYTTNNFGTPDVDNVSSGGTANAFNEISIYKTFGDGFAGFSGLNRGAVPARTWHLNTSSTTSRAIGDTVAIGGNNFTVVYFADYYGTDGTTKTGSVMVVYGSSSITTAVATGNGNVIYATEIEVGLIGLIRPNYFIPTNLITNSSGVVQNNSEFKMGVFDAQYFVHLPVKSGSGSTTAGVRVKGALSGTTGIIETGSSLTRLILSNVSGNFAENENVIAVNNSFTGLTYRAGEVDKIYITDNTISCGYSITVKYAGVSLELLKDTHYSLASGYNLTLLTAGINLVYTTFGRLVSYLEISTAKNTLGGAQVASSSGRWGFLRAVNNVQYKHSFDLCRSLYALSSTDNKFSADLSFLNIDKTASYTVGNGATFTAVRNASWFECQDFTVNPATQVVPGDVIAYTDSTGDKYASVLYATGVAGQGANRQRGRIYVTMPINASITSQITVLRSKSNYAGNSNLLHALPTSYTATIESNSTATDINYIAVQQFMGTLISNNTIVFTTSSTLGQRFYNDPSKYILTIADSTSSGEFGKIVNLTSSNLTFTENYTKVTIVLPYSPGNYAVKLTAPVQFTNATAKRKVFKNSIDPLVVLYTNQVGYISSGYDKSVVALGVVDAYNLRSVYAALSPGGNPTDISNRTDVTGRYYIDGGQRDDGYYEARLILKPGATPADGPLYADYDYFEHSSAGDFFSVDSYQSISYGDIPYYNSAALGQINLANFIDFRPTINPVTSSDPITNGVGQIGAVVFTGNNSNASSIPLQNSTFQCDITTYLPRRDSLYLAPTGEFLLVKGKSDMNPKYPNQLPGAMRLFDFDIPAYTSSVKSIRVKPYEYKVYRMSDINRIEKRLNNLEQVVALSAMESKTFNTQVRDAVTGLDRFKNGIIVEDFNSDLTGEQVSIDHSCSIDPIYGLLRSPCFDTHIELEEFAENSATISFGDQTTRQSNNYARNGSIIHLPYTREVLVSNLNVTGSINLQPYSVFTYIGQLALDPAVDTWKDVQRIEPNVIQDNDEYNRTLARMQSQGAFEPKFGNWNITWGGVPADQMKRVLEDQWWHELGGAWGFNVGPGLTNFGANATTLVRDAGAFTARGFLAQQQQWAAQNPNTALVDFTGGLNGHGISMQLNGATATRTVSRSVLNSRTINTVTGSKVLSNTSVPFMRRKVIKFISYGLKARTYYYAFFGGEDVSAWVCPDEPAVTANGLVNPLTPGTRSKGFGQLAFSDDNGVISGYFLIPNSNPPLKYVNATNHPGASFAYYGTTKTTGDAKTWYPQGVGLLDGSRIVLYSTRTAPSNPTELTNNPNYSDYNTPPTKSFSTGSKLLRFTSSMIDKVDGSLEAYAENTFTASGITEITQDTIVSTRVPEVTTVTRMDVNNTVRAVLSLGDPVAQTFTIDSGVYPTGLFVTDVDLYFKTQSYTEWVSVYLTETEQGRPIESIIPFSKVGKPPTTKVRVQCTLANGVDTITFPTNTYVTGVTSGAVGVVRWPVTFQRSTINPTTNTSNHLYNVEFSNTYKEFITGETITFTTSSPVTSTFKIAKDECVVSSVDITNFGVGYTYPATVSVQFSAPQNPGGVTATGTAKVSVDGKLYDVVVTNPGSGYTSTPAISFVGGGASVSAAANVNVRPGLKGVVSGVSISNGGTAPTNFKFQAPIYLKAGKTYALVAYAPTSVDYSVFISAIGGKKLLSDGTVSKDIVNKQPTTGSLFKSQDRELWTEDQTADMTFALYKAVFPVNTQASVNLNNLPLEKINIVENGISTNTGVGTANIFGANAKVIRVRTSQPHGKLPGDYVIIEGVYGPGYTSFIGGIDIKYINTQHTVVHSSVYTFDVVLSVSATSAVSVGIGGMCSCNRPYEIVNPALTTVTLPGTQLTATVTPTNGGTLDNGYGPTAYTLDSPFPIGAYDYYSRVPYLVASREDEVRNTAQTKLNANRSIGVNVKMSTSDRNLTPILDVDKSNMILIRNIIDNPTSTNDKYGSTIYQATLSANASLVVGNILYGVTNTTTLDGSLFKISSYNSTVKVANLSKIDSTNITPISGWSGFTKPASNLTTLNGAIDNSTTTVVLTSGAGFASGDVLLVGSEYMTISNVSTNTLTVTRGAFGSIAAPQSNSAQAFKMILIGNVFATNVATMSSTTIGSEFYVSELASVGSSSLAKWKSRTFTVQNPSDRIDLSVSALLMDINSLKVYYRISSENDSSNISEKGWVPFNGTGLSDNYKDAALSSSGNVDPSLAPPNMFFDYKFTAKDITPYVKVELKFVFNSTNPALSPMVDNFRMIVTA